MSELLLDTCALIWLANGQQIAPDSREVLEAQNIHISPISAWEIANLVRKNRIAFTLSVAGWFEHAKGKLAAATPQLTVDILINSCSLPGLPPTDPADRIIIATAREADMTVVTRDKKILAYSRAGHVRAMVC
jgi:PIN domain nuclease of toxin-antitoxin system